MTLSIYLHNLHTSRNVLTKPLHESIKSRDDELYVLNSEQNDGRKSAFNKHRSGFNVFFNFVIFSDFVVRVTTTIFPPGVADRNRS